MMVHVNRRQEHEGLRTLEFFFGLILKFFILGFLFLSTEVANLIEPRGSHLQYVHVAQWGRVYSPRLKPARAAAPQGHRRVAPVDTDRPREARV